MARFNTDQMLLKVGNVLTYIFLFSSNLYTSISPGHHVKESYLSPAPYWYYTWTLINALLLGFIVLQFFPEGHEPTMAIGWRFIGVALLNAAYVHLSSTKQYVLDFVAVILLTLVVSHCYYSLQTTPSKSLATSVFVHLPFSLWHAFSTVLLFVSGFVAFGRSTGHKAGIFTDVFVCIALALLSSTSVGYAFANDGSGDIAGAAVIAFALLGVFSEHKHPHLIHWFALGAFIIAAFSTVKAAVFAFRGKGRSHLLASSDSGERAPLVSGAE